MGSCCCCQSKGPCDSAEETSLLQNDPKAAVPSAETPSAGGTCGPGLEEDMSKGLLNKNAERERHSAQENGTLKKNISQPATLSSDKSPQQQANSMNAPSADVQSCAPELGEAGQQHSTLTPSQIGYAQADWDVSNKTSPEEEKCLNAAAEAVTAENLSLTETNPKQEHTIMDSINNNKKECCIPPEKCVDTLPIETVKVKEEEPLLNAPCAARVSQVLPISEINPEVDVQAEASSSVDNDDPENRSAPVCVEASRKEAQSHVPESSAGAVSTEFDHSGVEAEAACSVTQTTATADVCESLEQVEKSDPECSSKDPTENPELSEVGFQDEYKVHEEKQDFTSEKAEGASEAVTEAAEDPVVSRRAEQMAESTSSAAGVDTADDEIPVVTKQEPAEDPENSDEDLYRAAEELSAEQTSAAGPPSLSETFVKVDERCSLAPAVDILSYSEREWKGNTAKSALIRKGYKEMSQRFSSLRRVRGDNYCALRATLYQVLCHTTQMPKWLQDESVTMLPKELEAREGLISQWIFPGECLCGDGSGDATQQLQGYMEHLRNKWQAAADCPSSAERQQLCVQLFQGGEEELGLLEALKLLMLARAVELHGSIQKGEDTPLFCWLLFARDSSDCPRSFLVNHLSHVGLSAGLEQVEMFLLGYALQCTIQVYRLYKTDTEEFVTFYPDDHKDEWPCVCLVTEDDRHYNVPVLEAAEKPKELQSS